jgi:excisionase family DNA binding protein
MDKIFITLSNAMNLLSLSRQTINRFIARGEIPNYKVGKRRLFDRDELIEWVKSHRSGPILKGKESPERQRVRGNKIKSSLDDAVPETLGGPPIFKPIIRKRNGPGR